MSVTRLTENNITSEAATGKLLLRYSHTGEDPDPRVNPDRKLDDVTDGGHAPARIVGVRTSDTDNVVAVLCGALLMGSTRDPDTGQLVRDSEGKVLRAPLVPPEGEIEIGIGVDGWIEVDDGA